MRINGAWTGLLTDWLDQNQLDAPGTRSRLARYAPEDSVPVAVWRELLDTTLDSATPAAPELDVGACVQPRHVGVLGYLVLACETLGDAMLAYQRYERLFYGEQLAQIDTDGTDAEIRWPQTPEPLGQKADGVAIAALVTFLRRQLDDPPPPSGIAFHDVVSPEQAAAYEAFFDCPVVFGDDFVRVRFPLHSLQVPMPGATPPCASCSTARPMPCSRPFPGTSFWKNSSTGTCCDCWRKARPPWSAWPAFCTWPRAPCNAAWRGMA